MLLVFGLGYTGAAIAAAARDAGVAVAATTRDAAKAAPPAGVEVIRFEDAASAVARAEGIISTAPPPGDGGEDSTDTDPVLAAHGGAIAASRARWLGYLSTTGIYGDRQGGAVDETTPPAPGQPRSVRRLRAEQAWTDIGGGRAVDLFRVAGIYGPGRSPLDELRAGRGRRVDKAGHAFGRIHRDDIAAAVLAAFRQQPPPGVRVLNLTDDEAAPQADVVAEAAALLGVEPPPLIPFAEASARMSEMGRSFWEENRRVSSAATQAALGWHWRYPTYREGLRGILAEEARDRVDQQREIGGA